MSSPIDDLRDDLRAVFGEWGPSTGDVMIAPNTLAKEVVAKVVKSFPLDKVLYELGIIAARELANNIEALALRPADYANLPDLSETMSERLMQELGKDPDMFANAFLTELRNRG